MGLDTSHDAWHGPYSSFNDWRTEVAKHIGIENLREMEGFGGEGSWDKYKEHPLYPLLYHSDCEGELFWQDCGKISHFLFDIAPKMPGIYYMEKTIQFAEGAKLAFERQQNIDFH